MEIEQTFQDFKDNAVQEIFTDCMSVEINSRSQSMMLLLPGAISELTDNLVLTSASSVNTNVLDALNITCVINVAPELPDTPLHRSDIIYHKIPLLDSGNSRIYTHFDEAADLIHKVANSGGKTLIYCVAGVSRSASICLAYLMKHQGLTLLEAYNYVKLRRPKIKPNCGFFKQLIEYEKDIFGDNTVRMIFNEFVQMEIPDIYDCDYQFVSHFSKKKRNQRY
ncbi:dual specificity protein phosphatase 21 isoform X1 [Tribolium castaneum]|uniref:Dual specificity protein phosphatase Mpk3-like Protein n=2 Tax=Tribolium castaneum TaxID=7070 RepID=D6WN84_TRICA|nr:PREDICTED: dual specificity protein phosphatase 21 isoform X1 [Tribolium castaneum]XP_015835588.1 PREDICTED: dual specificity protein phosphatase 21 isoform X1 [Tribolium castaneum]XP_970550.1 PREDICTED: dual specificity protein phosphatase 21 isoform X1 [Tribolium castaneum]EFA03077.1 Dual specificity protein phosphatase Mpk3-like Protein [Tribolium castaneum]|eukprot:XP_008199330.1 PREDICTED: dual specificity protein phosphatase 21 isoform X1 [Tribolium castaneum]